MTIRLLGASQEHFAAQGVKAQIEKELEFERLGRATDPFALIDLSHALNPDVVVMCARFAGNSTAKFIHDYVQKFKQIGVVVMSGSNKLHSINEMLSAGVKGYLHCTTSTPEELKFAIREAAQARNYICQSVLNIMKEGEVSTKLRIPSHPLGDREVEVLQKVANGNSSKMIAKQMSISTSTVEVHRRNIMHKLDIHNVADLTRYAIKQKLIEI